MKTILLKKEVKRFYLLLMCVGFAFYGNTQTETGTQEFTAQGSDSNPAVISVQIPDDITVNNGEGIQSIVISNVEGVVDVGGSIPIGGFLNCGDIYSFDFSVDGSPLFTGECESSIQGEDVTNNTLIELSSFAESVISGFPLPIIPPFDIEIKLTLKVTYTECTADAGENTTITPCKNQPIVLMDELNGTPQTGGTWKDPNGGVVASGNVTTPNLEGQYTYTYHVEDDPNCTDDVSLVIDVQDCDYLAVGENQLENISIYPNPANDNVIIDGIKKGTAKVTLIDVNGRVLMPSTVFSNNTSIDLTGVQNGTYFVHIIKDNFKKVVRIIKI